MKTSTRIFTSDRSGGAIAFVIAIVLVLGLMVGAVVLFLAPSSLSVSSAYSSPRPAYPVLAWTFNDPAVEVRDGRWVIASEWAIAPELPIAWVDLISFGITDAFVTRGAARRRATFEIGPLNPETQTGPVVFELDALPGTAATELEISYRIRLKGRGIIDHTQRAELSFE